MVPGHLSEGSTHRADTQSTFAPLELGLQRSAEYLAHTHQREDETGFVPEGHFCYEVGNEELYAGPSDTVSPAG